MVASSYACGIYGASRFMKVLIGRARNASSTKWNEKDEDNKVRSQRNTAACAEVTPQRVAGVTSNEKSIAMKCLCKFP